MAWKRSTDTERPDAAKPLAEVIAPVMEALAEPLRRLVDWLSRKLDPDRHAAFKTLEMAGWLDRDDDLPMTRGIERLVSAWGDETVRGARERAAHHGEA